jgi:hypothetical protein
MERAGTRWQIGASFRVFPSAPGDGTADAIVPFGCRIAKSSAIRDELDRLPSRLATTTPPFARMLGTEGREGREAGGGMDSPRRRVRRGAPPEIRRRRRLGVHLDAMLHRSSAARSLPSCAGRRPGAAICLELAMVDLPVAATELGCHRSSGCRPSPPGRFPVPPPGLRGLRRPSWPSPPTRRRGPCLAGARKERGGAPVRRQRWGGAEGARGIGDERPCLRLEGPLGGHRVAAGLGTGARAAAADLTSRVVRITAGSGWPDLAAPPHHRADGCSRRLEAAVGDELHPALELGAGAPELGEERAPLLRGRAAELAGLLLLHCRRRKRGRERAGAPARGGRRRRQAKVENKEGGESVCDMWAQQLVVGMEFGI